MPRIYIPSLLESPNTSIICILWAAVRPQALAWGGELSGAAAPWKALFPAEKRRKGSIISGFQLDVQLGGFYFSNGKVCIRLGCRAQSAGLAGAGQEGGREGGGRRNQPRETREEDPPESPQGPGGLVAPSTRSLSHHFG
jgi:hypothetical protein